MSQGIQGKFAEHCQAPAPGVSGEAPWDSPGELQGLTQAGHGVSVRMSWSSLCRSWGGPEPAQERLF